MKVGANGSSTFCIGVVLLCFLVGSWSVPAAVALPVTRRGDGGSSSGEDFTQHLKALRKPSSKVELPNLVRESGLRKSVRSEKSAEAVNKLIKPSGKHTSPLQALLLASRKRMSEAATDLSGCEEDVAKCLVGVEQSCWEGQLTTECCNSFVPALECIHGLESSCPTLEGLEEALPLIKEYCSLAGDGDGGSPDDDENGNEDGQNGDEEENLCEEKSLECLALGDLQCVTTGSGTEDCCSTAYEIVDCLWEIADECYNVADYLDAEDVKQFLESNCSSLDDNVTLCHEKALECLAIGDIQCMNGSATEECCSTAYKALDCIEDLAEECSYIDDELDIEDIKELLEESCPFVDDVGDGNDDESDEGDDDDSGDGNDDDSGDGSDGYGDEDSDDDSQDGLGEVCEDGLSRCSTLVSDACLDNSLNSCCDQYADMLSCLEDLPSSCFFGNLDSVRDSFEDLCRGVRASSSCFPAGATVQLEDRSTKKMEELVAGDRVMVAGGTFSDVFGFGHRMQGIMSEFVVLETKNGAVLELSPSHYLPTADGKLVAARKVRRDDHVRRGDGSLDIVTRVSRVQREGLYNPHTLQGTIVVNDVLASTYTEAVHPSLAHLLLAVPRMLYRLGAKEPMGSVLYNSTPKSVQTLLPMGSAVVNANLNSLPWTR